MKTRDCCGTRPLPAALWLLASVFLLVAAMAATPAAAVTLNVEDASSGATISHYRWVVEQDLTYHVPFDGTNPVPEVEMQALDFHRSYMPVVAEGVAPAQLPSGLTLPNQVCSIGANSCGGDTDCTAGGNDRCVDAYYYVSVLPMASSADPNLLPAANALKYSIGGVQFRPSDTVTAYVNPNAIPSAQIVIQVCEDNNPINNTCDPGEAPIEGFEIIIEDAGGRYGMSAGLQSYDMFGNPLGTTYLDNFGTVDQMGSGINTDANGMAYVKNLAPGKYGVIIVPTDGQPWQQTSTIEGKKIIDAWVKANEPPYFAEFGPPGPHAVFGFVQPFNDLAGTGPTVEGDVVNLHMSRPPEFAMYAGGPFPHTTCWVGLNEFAGGVPGAGVYAERCGDNGEFAIPNVPAGEYQLVVWDDNMDLVFASMAVTVQADGGCNGNTTCDLGLVPTRQWFTRTEHWVFNDVDGDGIRDCVTETCMNAALGDEVGIPEQAVNLRWRDGTMYQSFATDIYGFAPFDEVFPFFAWLVAEVDFARLNATGVTVYVDDGGEIAFDNNNTWDRQLNPQFQGDPILPAGETAHAGYGGNPGDARAERGVVLSQAFQGFLGQTSVFEWGKAPHDAGSNGGIGGVVYYSTTRAEDDPRYGGAEPWEPGIPNITVNLYEFGPDLEPGTGDDVLVATTVSDSWDLSQPDTCQYGSGGPFTYSYVDDFGVVQTVEIDCYDGMRVWNQVRPGVFDGGYAFDAICGDPAGLDPVTGTCAVAMTSPIPNGRYVVEVVPPAAPTGYEGYKVVRSQDKNVDFGDEYVSSGLLLPPECVGATYTVPNFLSLNSDGYAPLPGVDAGDLVPTNLATQTLNHCDKKKVAVSGGNNAAADFFLFTQTPVASHAVGFILDDTANEFDPNSPQFGEKYAAPFLPVGIRDWTGREIGRTYSDQYGRYNFLAPSSWTNSLPQPSGMSPNMLTTCMNAKSMPDGAGGFVDDLQHNPLYSQFCYTFQYMPGATVYLDTPVVPVAAFTGADQFPLDCEYENGTPRIFSVTNIHTDVDTDGGGPYFEQPDRRTDDGTLSIFSMGNVGIPNPAYCPASDLYCVQNDIINNTKTLLRDFGFGDTPGTVTLNGTPVIVDNWTNDRIWVTVQEGHVPDAPLGYQLEVTRGDNNLSSINAVTVQVDLRRRANVINVSNGGSIQAAIDAAQDNDLILVGPGTYTEMVIMWKPVQLQGWGEGTQINAIKAPPEALQIWRDKVESLVTGGQVTLLPGQEAQFGGVEPVALWNEEGAGVLVLAKAGDFDKNENQGARIDGLNISGADTGGGIILNGYASEMQISNNRVINNSGQYGGGIRVGHPALLAEGPVCSPADVCYPDAENDNVIVKHNYVGQNGGVNGAGAGVSLCTGSNNYALTDNYVCGNFNMDQGGGVAHYGYSAGDNLIARNTIVFNDNFKQTPGSAPAGGGVLIAGQPPVQGELLSVGSGNVVVDGNLILGNAAEAGDGGGIRLQAINGQDVDKNPSNPNQWHAVEIVNNMVANNLAGLAGGGISISDAKMVTIRHNTIVNNDSTATAGNAFTTGLPDLSAGQLGAGIASRRHSDELLAAQRPTEADFSDAVLEDNIVWHNRTFRFYGLGTTPDPNSGLDGWFGLCPTIGGAATNCEADTVGAWDGVDPLYSNIAVLGSTGTLDCTDCLVDDLAAPGFVASYATGNRAATANQLEQQTIHVPTAFDEGGNFIRLRFGPLTRWDHSDSLNPHGQLLGDYHLTADLGGAGTDDPATDFDGDLRPQGGGSDQGADEYCAAGNGACAPLALKSQQNVSGNTLTDGIVD